MKVWVKVKEFSAANRIVHHLSALFFLGALMLMAYDRYAGSSDAMYLHQSFGMMVFFLYFGRIVLMSWFGKPEALGTQFEKFAAHMAHIALYGILILMPLSGFLVNASRGLETSIFGIISVPGLGQRYHDLYLLSLELHSLLEYACYILLFAHIGASMMHHFILKDETMKRMWGKISSGIFHQ